MFKKKKINNLISNAVSDADFIQTIFLDDINQYDNADKKFLIEQHEQIMSHHKVNLTLALSYNIMKEDIEAALEKVKHALNSLSSLLEDIEDEEE